MQKFIHDNEQYVLEVKRKQGKTKIDKEINEYLRKKKNNNTSLFNNNNNNNNNSMNNNNYNIQMMNNSLLAMNYLLLQNQFLMQQRNPNLVNQINSSIMPQNIDDLNTNGNLDNFQYNYEQKGDKFDNIQKNIFGEESEVKNEKENNIGPKEGGNTDNRHENIENEEPSQNNEIIKKILEALNGQNNVNNNEERLSDPRKKGK